MLLIGGGVAGALLWRSVQRRGEDALRRVPPALIRYKLIAEAPVTLGTARDGLGVLTAPAEARDGLAVDDPSSGAALTLVATSGGLLVYRGAADPLSGLAPPPRLFTHLDGLSAVSLRAAAALPAGRVVLGDSSGGLTVLQRDRATALRLALPGQKGAGAIIDLLAAGMNGDVLYILVQDLGLLAWDPTSDEVIDVGRSTGVDLREATALCSGAAGLAVGTASGQLLRERGGKLGVVGTVPERVTALSCTGPRVYVGTPIGLYATSTSDSSGAGPLALLRPDLAVTALLDNGLDQGAPGAVGSLVVGTFDDGVLRFEVAGQRLRPVGHQIPQRRVLRLRPAHSAAAARVETVLAFTTSRSYRLAPGAPESAPLPLPATSNLSGPHVTALTQDGRGRLWVGTFEHGIDLLDPQRLAAAGAVLGHRPQPSEPGGDNINALLYQPRSDEVLAATVRGVDRYGGEAQRPRRVGPAQGLIGDQVQALAVTADDALAVATSRGLTLLRPDSARSLYAFHGLAANRVYALLAEGPRLYAGTLAGVSIIEKDAVVRSHTPASTPGLAAGWISALASCEGEIFIGSYGGGLSALLPRRGDSGGREPTPVRVAALPESHVNPGALLCEGGQLYVGTLEAGLWRLDPRSRAANRVAPRLLPSQSVTALAVARTAGGPLFLVGTEAGLVWLTPERLRGALQDAGEIL